MVPTLSSLPRSLPFPFEKPCKGLENSWGYVPLTPPSSPVLYTSTSEDDFDCCFRIQPVCGFYDDITEEHAYALASGFDLPIYNRPGKSVVIKDCMWGHWSTNESNRQDSEQKLNLEAASEIRDTVEDSIESSTAKLVGVDPSEVFPHHDDTVRMQSLSDCSDSEDDSDIDVVTVESSYQPVSSVEKPQSPSLVITPPKTPETDQPSNDIQSPVTKSTSHWATKLKIDVPKAAVKSLSIIASRQTPKSPKKSAGAIGGDLKYSRTSHNVLERKRRNELKMRFYNLRDSIPELTKNDKVPKVTILKQAILYVKSLKSEESVLLAEQQKQRKINADLRRRLAVALKQA